MVMFHMYINWKSSLVPRPAPFSVTRKLSQGLGSKITSVRPRVEQYYCSTLGLTLVIATLIIASLLLRHTHYCLSTIYFATLIIASLLQ